MSRLRTAYRAVGSGPALLDLSMRLARSAIALIRRVPPLAWLALAGWLIGPWLIRYWMAVLGVEFFVPRVP